MPLLLLLAALIGAAASCGSDAEPLGSEATAELLVRGESLYQQACASCHGVDLRGTDKGPSHLSVVYEPNHHPDAAFQTAVSLGAGRHHWNFGDMPPIEGLDDDEVDAIIAFVRATQEREGFESYPPK